MYYLTGLFILILSTVNIIALPASSPTNERSETAKQDSIITAKTLYDAFKNDADAASKKYANKTMTIKGFITYTGPDPYALPSIELSERKGGKSRIMCVLPFSDYLKLRKVSKGDEVLIEGEIRGFYEKGDQVVVKKSVVIERNGKKQ